MKYDVIIIGGGLGGLECGYILSRQGKNVLLLEKDCHVGGCLYSYKRGNQAFDTGLHYVGGLEEGQSLYTVFSYLGLLKLPWKRLDKLFDRVTIGEQTFHFAQGYEAFVEGFSEQFPDEHAALERYVAMLQDAESHSFDALNPQAEDTTHIFDLFGQGAYPYLRENFRNTLLIDVLSGTSLKMELRKESLPLFTFAHGNAAFIESSWRLKGSGSLIAETLADGIRANGGTVITNAEVEELLEKNDVLVAVRCRNKMCYTASLFISDVHPALTCSWIRQSKYMRPIYRHRIAGLENTFGMFTASLCLLPGRLRYFNWNQYVYKEPDVWTFYQNNRPVRGVLVSCKVPEDGSAYVTQIDLLTPMTWADCRPWAASRQGNGGAAYNEMKQQMAEECIRLAERFIPGLHTMVTACYTSTPLTYRDFTATPDGSAYGLRKDFRRPMTTLLSPRTPIPNLFLTGQNLMLHGVQGVTMTSLFTCAEVLGKEPLWQIIHTND